MLQKQSGTTASYCSILTRRGSKEGGSGGRTFLIVLLPDSINIFCILNLFTCPREDKTRGAGTDGVPVLIL